jgi:hypothetical protein
VIWAFVSLSPALAFAQASTPDLGGPPPTASSAAPAGSLGSYAWSSTPPARRTGGVRARAKGPEATLPGFESLADGSTRLFVQLTKSVPVEERKAKGVVTYVLKGAHVGIWNNTNALVTVHFNTPVSRARLVPRGADLHFVVELRANVTPTWKMNATKDGTAMLSIELPRGDYLGGAPAPAAPATPAPSAAPAPAPAAPAKSAAPAPSASAPR